MISYLVNYSFGLYLNQPCLHIMLCYIYVTHMLVTSGQGCLVCGLDVAQSEPLCEPSQIGLLPKFYRINGLTSN